MDLSNNTKKYYKKDLDFIRQNYTYMKIKNIAAHLKKSPTNVSRQIFLMKLKGELKDKEWI